MTTTDPHPRLFARRLFITGPDGHRRATDYVTQDAPPGWRRAPLTHHSGVITAL